VQSLAAMRIRREHLLLHRHRFANLAGTELSLCELQDGVEFDGVHGPFL
jgi:hypothetical protein